MSFGAIPEAWVVRCKGCSCIVTCFATDPQAEHLATKKPELPYAGAVLVTCSCCWHVFRYLENEVFRGQQPRKNDQCNRSEPQRPKNDGTLVVAASVVAAIRLRGEEVRPSPKLKAVIHDSLQLVRLLMAEIQK